jgi:two-component system sensor histidine kinase KdpD
VSHDLRTPLATIRAAAGSLADPEVELSDADRRAAAGAIDAEADRLNRLVGDLLDMSRIQGGALVADIEVIPLAELVVPAVERARAAAGYRPIEVELAQDLPSVRADAALLDQVVSNLLENAVRYAGSDAPIRVRGDAKPDDATVSLVVEDGGAGVPDEALPRVFDRFYRAARSTDGARRGFGLGLAVVKGLVDAMGGTVTAAKSSMGGLAVTVVLPAEPAVRDQA